MGPFTQRKGFPLVQLPDRSGVELSTLVTLLRKQTAPSPVPRGSGRHTVPINAGTSSWAEVRYRRYAALRQLAGCWHER